MLLHFSLIIVIPSKHDKMVDVKYSSIFTALLKSFFMEHILILFFHFPISSQIFPISLLIQHHVTSLYLSKQNKKNPKIQNRLTKEKIKEKNYSNTTKQKVNKVNNNNNNKWSLFCVGPLLYEGLLKNMVIYTVILPWRKLIFFPSRYQLQIAS